MRKQINSFLFIIFSPWFLRYLFRYKSLHTYLLCMPNTLNITTQKGFIYTKRDCQFPKRGSISICVSYTNQAYRNSGTYHVLKLYILLVVHMICFFQRCLRKYEIMSSIFSRLIYFCCTAKSVIKFEIMNS